MNSALPVRKSLVQQRTPREQRDDVDAAGFDGLAAAFLTIDKDEGEGDLSTLALDGVDGLQRGAARGDDIIDDDDGVAGFEIPLDLFARAMALGFLADGEYLERFLRVAGGGSHADRQRNRISTESHAADGIDLEVLGMNLGTDRMPTEVADEIGPEGVERGHATVDVKVALFARCEGEGAGADGFLEQKAFEGSRGMKHGRDDGVGGEMVQSGKMA
jgi:hypothetical protein